MKGVVLAGGRGTRLQPMTHVVNKHVLPVYDDPMIYYPVRTLLSAGIDDILVISNADHIGKYIELLEEADFDANFRYRVQKEPKGIAHAISLAEDFVDDGFAVVLGDNIILGDISSAIDLADDETAKIFLKQVDKPAAYGVAEIEDGKVQSLQEKPDSPRSNLAVIGLYLYDTTVFDVIREIEPSDRGEYEITDVNKRYVERGELAYEEIDNEWFDTGTPEGLFQASERIRSRKD
jgi:glucose-1-phosphate thymidylyltransferase